MANITKNTQSYDAGDVKVHMLGIPEIYAEAISYKTMQEHQRNYGLSRNPRSYSKGKKNYECSITLYQEDIVAIQNANSGKSLLDIKPFPIIVTFDPNVDEDTILPPVVDKVVAKFEDSGREVGSDDMGLKFQYTMFVIDIQENIPQ